MMHILINMALTTENSEKVLKDGLIHFLTTDQGARALEDATVHVEDV